MNDPLSVDPAPDTSEYVKVSPLSVSVVVNVPTVVPEARFSFTELLLRVISVGDLLSRLYK